MDLINNSEEPQINERGQQLPVFLDYMETAKTELPDASPFELKSQASERLLEDVILPGVRTGLSEETYAQYETEYTKLKAIPDPIERGQAIQKYYLTATDQLLSNLESKRGWFERNLDPTTIDEADITDFKKLRQLAEGTIPTSLWGSLADQAVKQASSDITGFQAQVKYESGAPVEEVKAALDLAKAKKGLAEAIKIPENFEKQTFWEALWNNPLDTAVGGTIRNFPSLVGSTGALASAPAAIAVMGTYYATTTSGGSFTDIYDDLLEVTGDEDVALRQASNVSIAKGLIEGGTGGPMDALGGVILKSGVGSDIKRRVKEAVVRPHVSTAATAMAFGSFGKTFLTTTGGSLLSESMEELSIAFNKGLAHQAILVSEVEKGKEKLDEIEKTLGKDSDAYKALNDSLTRLVESGDVTKIKYGEILNETLKNSLGFGSISGIRHATSNAVMRKSRLKTSDIEILNAAMDDGKDFEQSLRKVKNDLTLTKDQKKEKMDTLEREFREANIFKIDFKARNSNKSLNDLGDLANEVKNTLENKNASTDQKTQAIETFETLYGQGAKGHANYLKFGNVGAIVGQTETTLDERRAVLNDVMQLQDKIQSEQDIDDARQQADTARVNVQASVTKTQTSLESVPELANNLMELTRQIQDVENGTFDGVRSEMFTQLKDLSDVAIDDLVKYSKKNVINRDTVNAIESVAKDRKEIRKTDDRGKRLIEKAILDIDKGNTKNDPAFQNYKSDLQSYLNSWDDVTTTAEAKDRLTNIEADLAWLKTAKDNAGFQARQESMINRIDKILDGVGSRRIEVIDGFQDLTNGKALSSLSLPQLSRVLTRVDSLKRKFDTEGKVAAKRDAISKRLESMGDNQEALDLIAYGEKQTDLDVLTKLEAEAKALSDAFKKDASNYNPTDDLISKYGVADQQGLIAAVDNVVNNGTIKELKQMLTDLGKIAAKFRFSSKDFQGANSVDAGINVSMDHLSRAIQAKEQDSALVTASASALKGTRLAINRLFRKMDSDKFRQTAEDLGVGVLDDTDIDADIDRLRDLAYSLDSLRAQPFDSDAQYRSILTEMSNIENQYRSVFDMVQQAQEARDAELADLYENDPDVVEERIQKKQEAEDEKAQRRKDKEPKKKTKTKKAKKSEDETDTETDTGEDVDENVEDDEDVTIEESLIRLVKDVEGQTALREILQKDIAKVQLLGSDPIDVRLSTLVRRFYLHSAFSQKSATGKRLRDEIANGTKIETYDAGIRALEKVLEGSDPVITDPQIAKLARNQLAELKDRRDKLISEVDAIAVNASGPTAPEQEFMNLVEDYLRAPEGGKSRKAKWNPHPAIELFMGYGGWITENTRRNNYHLVVEHLPSSFLSSMHPDEFDSLHDYYINKNKIKPFIIKGIPTEKRMKAFRDALVKEKENRSWRRAKRKEYFVKYPSQAAKERQMLLRVDTIRAIMGDAALLNDFSQRAKLASALDEFFLLRDVHSGQAGIFAQNEISSFAITNEVIARLDSRNNKEAADDGVTLYSISGNPVDRDVTITKDLVTRADRDHVTILDQALVDEILESMDQVSGFAIEDMTIIERPDGVAPEKAARVVNAGTNRSRVEIFADSIRTVSDFNRLMRHESFGHRFLPAILGRRLWRKLKRYVEHKGGIGNQSIAEIKARYKKAGVELSDGRAIGEALAFHAEIESNTDPAPIWKEAFGSMKVFVKSMFRVNLSDGDVQHLYRMAFKKYKQDASRYKEAARDGAQFIKDLDPDDKTVFKGEMYAIAEHSLIRDRFLREAEAEIITLDGPAAAGHGVSTYLTEVGNFLERKFGLRNANQTFEIYMANGNPQEMTDMFDAHPEVKAPMERLRKTYLSAHGANVDVIDRLSAQYSRIHNLSKEDARDFRQIVKNLRDGLRSFKTKIWGYSNSHAGFMAFLSGAGQDAIRFIDDKGEVVKGIRDASVDIVAAARRGKNHIFTSIMGLSDRGDSAGTSGILSAINRIEVKTVAGKTVTSVSPDVISNQTLPSRIAKFLAIDGLTSEENSANFNSYLFHHQRVEMAKQGSKDVTPRMVDESRNELLRLSGVYRGLGTNPIQEILEFYYDLSVLMEQSGQFTRDQIMGMRVRKTVDTRFIGGSATMNSGTGLAQKSALASIVQEVQKISEIAGRADFHSTLTNLMNRLEQGTDSEYKRVVERVSEVVYKETPSGTKGLYKYSYLQNGKPVFLVVRDKNFHDSLRILRDGDGGSPMNLFLRALQFVSRLKRQAITKFDPAFFAANLMKDAMTTYSIGFSDANGYKDVSFNLEYRKHLQEQARYMGGIDSNETQGQANTSEELENRGIQELTKKNKGLLSKAKVPFSAINRGADALMDIGEATGRLAIASTQIDRKMDWVNEAGISVQERNRRAWSVHSNAFDKTRDVMNFAQRGTSPFLNKMMQMSAFARVGITALERAFRTWADVFRDPQMRKAASIRAVSVFGASAAMLYLLTEDDEALEDLSPSERARYYYIPSPYGGYITIPKGFLAAGMMANMVEATLRWVRKDDPAMAKAMATDLINGFLPNFPGLREPFITIGDMLGVKLNPSMKLMPDLLDLGFQIKANYDNFREMPIAKEFILHKHPEFRFHEGNMPVFKYLSSKTGVAADHMEFALSQTIGYSGLQYFKFADSVFDEGGKWYDMPFFKRFVSDESRVRSKSLSWFYNTRKDLMTKQSGLRSLQDTDTYKTASRADQQAMVAEILEGDIHHDKKMKAFTAMHLKIKNMFKLFENDEKYKKLTPAAQVRAKNEFYKQVSEFRMRIKPYESN